MIGYLNNLNKQECFGCSGCEQICPRKAISMIRDEEGFWYPKITKEICCGCGKCHQVCPAEKEMVKSEPIMALAGYNKNNDVRMKSASGGAFHSIISAFDVNAVVFGAEWRERSFVCHTFALRDDAYDKFSKSKYIQSYMGDSFEKVKEFLTREIQVIFTGTPCQIAGLKMYLGKDYENLFTVDLVCHGVPSGKVLEAYLKNCEKRNDLIERIDFRHKKNKNGKWESKCAQIFYSSGKKKIVDYDSSAFLRGFANGLFFRESCSICPYAQKNRVSDLTIGDFWGIEKVSNELNPHQGISLILVNSMKGKKIVEKLSLHMEMQLFEVDTAINGNARLRCPDNGHPRRKDFFELLGTKPFDKIVNTYIPRISKGRKCAYVVKKFFKERKCYGK